MNKALQQKLSLFLIAVVFLFVCTACGGGGSDAPAQSTLTPEPTPISSPDTPARVESGIIGSWRWDSGTEYIYTFHKDGTGSYTYGGQELPFDYIDNGDSVSLQYPNSTAPNVFRVVGKYSTLLALPEKKTDFYRASDAANGCPVNAIAIEK